MMLVGSLIPIIGKLLSHLCKFTCALADRLADPDCIYLKNDFPTAEVLTVVLTIMFFGFAILKIKRKDLYVLILTVVFAACNILPIINYSHSINNDAISYYSFEKSDVFVIKSEGKVGLISSSQYSKNLAYDTVEILKNESILTLDSYYLTHYSYSVEDDLEIVLSNIKTKNLYLPKPTNDDEKAILKKLTRFLSDYSTQINLIGRNESFRIGSCKATHLYAEPYGEDSSMNAFAISNLNETILYLSSGILSTKESELMYDFLSCSDKIILGRHGKKYKEHIYFRETFSRVECIIMNSNNLFLTQEAMEEYTKNGCEIISHPSMVELLD